MKPHLYKLGGFWNCVSRRGVVSHYFNQPLHGFGFTPLMAYQDLMKLREATA